MKRFHIALSVQDVGRSVMEYSGRLSAQPIVVVPGEYALWRTESLNFSIRQSNGQGGLLRHVGWEDEVAHGFSMEPDCNGLVWERFTPAAQVAEIKHLWPDAKMNSDIG